MRLYTLLKNVITNVRPIKYGGTGATTAAGIRNNLGLGNTTGALPIANGGTEATTAAGARSNLGFGGKVLWSGGYYMSNSHTANLSEAVNAQPNGIVLMWSEYTNGSADNSGWRSYFIPKWMVSNHPNNGYAILRPNYNASILSMKYVYVSNTAITGHSINTTGTTTLSGSGIITTNNRSVLRYVIGV